MFTKIISSAQKYVYIENLREYHMPHVLFTRQVVNDSNEINGVLSRIFKISRKKGYPFSKMMKILLSSIGIIITILVLVVFIQNMFGNLTLFSKVLEVGYSIVGGVIAGLFSRFEFKPKNFAPYFKFKKLMKRNKPYESTVLDLSADDVVSFILSSSTEGHAYMIASDKISLVMVFPRRFFKEIGIHKLNEVLEQEAKQNIELLNAKVTKL